MKDLSRFASMVRSSLIGLALLWAALPSELAGQYPSGAFSAAPESVTVVPGRRYQAGWFFSLMAGRGYRDLWTAPLKVEVADLSRLGGGLTPVRVGGGVTSKTLHARGADSKQYVLRSVDKYPAQGLPEELRGTPIESVIQDQISSFHPSGALVVASLLEAVGVLHAQPRLMVVPGDPRLDKFRDEFAELLVLFEERPHEGSDGIEGFANSRKIVGSERLFELVEQDPRHQVDAREFLKARLVDLLVGDRDRSVNNWLWARFEDGKRYIWQPIPRDRDQAFIRLDGVLKSLLRFYEPRLVAFDEDYPSIVGLTRNAWDLDRNFLVGLDKRSWDSVVAELQGQLTDSVIDEAVRQLPPEHNRLIGATLAWKLKKRRDRLHQAADHFYKIVNSYADIHATDKAEFAVVDRFADSVEVRLYRRNEGSGGVPQSPYFRRAFDRRETREIRLYLHGYADKAVIRGAAQRTIKTRIVGGGGADVLIDSSTARGTQTYFYDAGEETSFVRGPNTVIAHRHAPRPVSWGKFSALTPDWGHTWRPAPQLTVDKDRGLFVAGGVTRHGYGFLKSPYSSRIQLSGGYAAGAQRFVFDYFHDLREVMRHVHLSLHCRWSGIEILHFYGFGNGTQALGSRDFFKVEQQQLLLAPSVTASGERGLEFGLGPVLKVSSTETSADAGTFLAKARPYGSGSFSQLGAQTTFRMDTRDRSVAATRGFLLAGGGSYYPALFDVDRRAFGGIHGEVSTYLSPPKLPKLTLALRVGAKKMWGTVPFHEAAFVGGVSTVRGFREQRYAGNAAVYGNAELRVFLTKLFFLFPTDFGVFGLTDVGRVFQNGETSERWHKAIGGGIWLAPVQRSNTFTLTVARSVERTAFYIGTGFLF